MKSNRLAVATFFFVNGFLYANWAARLPELQRFFQISNAALGSLLFISAAGALVAMPFAGWFTIRYGSDKMTRTAAYCFYAFVSLLAFSSNYFLGAFFFFGMGVSSGALDISMNGQAVFVERAYKKPIMSSFHAVFSIGMALGAGTGALFAKFNWSLQAHFLLVALAGMLASIWASLNLVQTLPSTAEEKKSQSGGFRLPSKAIVPLGIIAFCCMTGEGSMADWSAIFMNKVVGENDFFSALAFGAFGSAMTIGRIFGDYFTARLGKYKLLIYSSILAISGLITALAFVSSWTALAGFFLVGLGLATVVPIVYSTAGNTPGVEPSVGIAMATSIGYAGFFIGPPAIGYLADQFGLRWALCFTLVLFFAMLLITVRIMPKKELV